MSAPPALTGDPRIDLALWRLARVLAAIAREAPATPGAPPEPAPPGDGDAERRDTA
ncbi:MAG TPA: hypothetical protein VFL91_05810 [Thermomicrobiales bacterium]|nr:hypothetical protein [Thermomicrobiales bacterium]